MPTRSEIENFLFYEAELLDTWRLEEWFSLLSEEAIYEIPPTDESRDKGDARSLLYLISDDAARIRGRVKRLLSKGAFVEEPRSRTRRFITNVRICNVDSEGITVKANFMVNKFRFGFHDVFVGEYKYVLLPDNGTFKIKERHAFLDMEALRPIGSISFIL